MPKKVLVLGASGKIGFHSASAFKIAGWKVKNFNRHEENLNEAAKDADVIVNGLNPPNYHDWENIIPQITKEVITASRENNATVLVPGNVYHFGDQDGVWSENTSPNPVSKKGKIRLEMERTYKESGVKTVVLRAGNFIDPERNGCIMSLVYLRNIAKNKIMLPGDPNVKQAMCYLPDWGRAAVELSEKQNELSNFADIPFPGHTFTANEIKSGLEEILNTRLGVASFPWWIFNLTSPFWELAREMKEMRYLWNTDHELSGETFYNLLPEFQMTDRKTVLAAALPKDMKQKTTKI